jgi:hypothetical protein
MDLFSMAILQKGVDDGGSALRIFPERIVAEFIEDFGADGSACLPLGSMGVIASPR